MANRKSIHISGKYFVHHKLYAFFIYVLCVLKNERLDKIVFYVVFKTQRSSDTRCFDFGIHVEFIPTAVSSICIFKKSNIKQNPFKN